MDYPLSNEVMATRVHKSSLCRERGFQRMLHHHGEIGHPQDLYRRMLGEGLDDVEDNFEYVAQMRLVHPCLQRVFLQQVSEASTRGIY